MRDFIIADSLYQLRRRLKCIRTAVPQTTSVLYHHLRPLLIRKAIIARLCAAKATELDIVHIISINQMSSAQVSATHSRICIAKV
jgi:hypothetical protein